MNRQQALNQLRLMQAWHEDNGNGPCPDYDAICYAIGVIEAQPDGMDTIIKALEQEHKRLLEMQKAQPEPCEDAVSRKDCLQALSHLMDVEGFRDGWAVSRANVECMLKAMPPVTPKQRTGKWILDRSGAYCCSECMEPCAGYVMMKPRDKFCKMCGAKMEGVSE